MGPVCWWSMLSLALDSEMHQAKTRQSHRESLDRRIKFDWDLLPGCSRWLGFINDTDFMKLSGRMSHLSFWHPKAPLCWSSAQICTDVQWVSLCFCIPGCRAGPACELICLMLRITSCPLFSRQGQCSSTGRRCQSRVRGRQGMNN